MMMMMRMSEQKVIWLVKALFVASVMFAVPIAAQTVVDKTVATVSDGLQTEVITLSDLRWQLALQPSTPVGPYTSEELNAALRTLIDQRIYMLEANRLPRNPPSKQEVGMEIGRIMAGLTASEFEARLRAVGFSSVDDERFQQIIKDRLAIEKFIDFRFKTFIVITPKDEETYYREVFVPDFRRNYRGLLMPTLDEKRKDINKTLIEERGSLAIEAYLEAAKQRVTIAIISSV